MSQYFARIIRKMGLFLVGLTFYPIFAVLNVVLLADPEISVESLNEFFEIYDVAPTGAKQMFKGMHDRLVKMKLERVL